MKSVYFVTNRKPKKEGTTKEIFENKFGDNPSELRMAEVQYGGSLKKGDLRIEKEILYDDKGGSQKLFEGVQKKMKSDKRDCLVFVHGFNNGWDDAIDNTVILAELYDIEVVCFTWPSDGFLKYRDCKRRAIETVPAFDRFIEKLISNLGGVDSENNCGRKLSLLCHSMGNYILKHFVRSSFFNNEFIPFNNINLVAPDVNNSKHVKFVDKINSLRDINIVMNEDDIALDVSDSKAGAKQKVRLGNYAKKLYSEKANYYNLTDAKGIGRSHGYFNDQKLLSKNPELFTFFNSIFHGNRVKGLKYCKGLNYYEPKNKE